MKSPLARLALVFLVLPVIATAQDTVGDWYVAPSIAYVDDDPDRAVADAVAGFQVSGGRHLTEHLSFEGLLGYNSWDGFVNANEEHPDQGVLDLSANLLAFLDRNKMFSPYVLVGIGYQFTSIDKGGFDVFGNSIEGGSDNRPTATLGLGFKWRVGQGQFSIRGEARARMVSNSEASWTGSGNLTDNIVSVGVQYGFGKKSTVPAPEQTNVDTDGDGVLDMWDECPETPRGVEVTSRGCELVNIDRDADGDRVVDRLDECPNTPAGAPVDPQGCSLDSDRDGVTTDMDRCPATPPGAEVDSFGCSLDRDSDEDGVVNRFDRCPNTTPGSRIDSEGCEFTDLIRLPGVNFGAGSDLLLPGGEARLQSTADTLNRYPDLQVEVAGHTDSDGSGEVNFGLSERRANTVRDHLIMFGVDEARLTAVGYGESQPIADNETVRGRAANRRVELRIVSR
jgi:OOP family OmpA-OmpF porin